MKSNWEFRNGSDTLLAKSPSANSSRLQPTKFKRFFLGARVDSEKNFIWRVPFEVLSIASRKSLLAVELMKLKSIYISCSRRQFIRCRPSWPSVTMQAAWFEKRFNFSNETILWNNSFKQIAWSLFKLIELTQLSWPTQWFEICSWNFELNSSQTSPLGFRSAANHFRESFWPFNCQEQATVRVATFNSRSVQLPMSCWQRPASSSKQTAIIFRSIYWSEASFSFQLS